MRNKAERVFAQIYRKVDRILSIGVRPGMTIEEEREVSNANLLFILVFILGLNMIFEIMHFHLYRYYLIPIITIAIAAIGVACSIKFGRAFLPSSGLLLEELLARVTGLAAGNLRIG